MEYLKQLGSLPFLNTFSSMVSGDVELFYTWSSGNQFSYKLFHKASILRIPEDQYQESEHYFYSIVSNPGDTEIYQFVSQNIGGAILFRGRGRWSGSGRDLGEELGIPLLDVIVNKTSLYAMKIEDVTKIVTEAFPELKFEISTKEGIVIDWTDIDPNLILKYSKNVDRSLKEWDAVLK